jgi:hypothetical protein
MNVIKFNRDRSDRLSVRELEALRERIDELIKRDDQKALKTIAVTRGLSSQPP